MTNKTFKFNPAGLREEHHQKYNFEVNSLVRNEFENNQKVKTLFLFTGDILFNKKQKFSSGPIIILISGPESKTTRFFNHLRYLLEKHLSESLMDYEIEAEKSPSRLEFESVTFDHLRTHNKKILLLRGIDNLIGASPLVLHSLSDPESSPFKTSFVIASVTPENISKGQKNCEDNVLK